MAAQRWAVLCFKLRRVGFEVAMVRSDVRMAAA
jgi:hypothetical protein